MKVHLMFKDRDFNINQPLPPHHKDLTSDLELEILFEAMSNGDELLYDASKKALLSSLDDIETILYRQGVLKDCIRNPNTVREIYSIATEAIQKEKGSFLWAFSKTPGSILSSSVRLMESLIDTLKKLKAVADRYADSFTSEGFTNFINTIRAELTTEYFNIIQEHLKRLEFRSGILVSAGLGEGNRGINYVLREPTGENKGWKTLFKREESYTFSIHERDEAGFKALSELKDKSLYTVATAAYRVTVHVLSFFKTLRAELAFYIGALNLRNKLLEIGEPVCFPHPTVKNIRSFKGLYEPCLALTSQKIVVGNDLSSEGVNIVFITGANQGGKSVFLRSIGVAQIMMQCGMFVPASEYSGRVCPSIFTHFKRQEDEEMESGKFDEEMKRMSFIVDRINKGSLVLFNESFASTNELEGSEVAKQILMGLMESGIESFYVTHMYRLTEEFFKKGIDGVLFLRAHRDEDGRRTFKIIPGEPLHTSFGKDLYIRVFGDLTTGNNP